MKKNIVILGGGESAIGAALLAKQKGHAVFVSDGSLIKKVYKQELISNNILFEEAQHTEEKILNADVVIKSPGIPEKAEIVKKIRNNNVQIISEIEFAYWYKGDSKIVAITGSNGKSTTTALTYHIFKKANYSVSMVGNIGYSFARQIFEEPTDWYILEVSSFQLDDIDSFRPDVAVLLNITPDHLDRYNYQFENYIASKFRIIKNQTASDFFVVNKDDEVCMSYINSHNINSQILYFTMQDELNQDGASANNERMIINFRGDLQTVSISDIAIQGKHNTYNSMASGISARTAEIRKEKIREAMSDFKNLEHRLEKVATIRGVEFINDSKATNLNSVWFALESMKKTTVLILGGIDKGNDYSLLNELVSEKVKAIVCMGVDNSAIHKHFDGIVPIVDTTSAKEAVKSSFELAQPGEIVLLSPACASFDLFQNFEDRGTQFKDAVKEL